MAVAAALKSGAATKLDALANALQEAGLIQLDDSSRARIFAHAFAASDEPLALLQEAGCPPAFFLDCIGDLVDAVDSLNSGLTDQNLTFVVDAYTRSGLTLRLVPHSQSAADTAQEAADDGEDKLAFAADTYVEDVAARLNQALADAGAEKRIYQLFNSESAAFAVLTAAAAERLDQAGVKLGLPSSWP